MNPASPLPVERLLSEPMPKMLVVGDVMLDEFLRGLVQRLSPEAPVPVLESSAREIAPGGAANVAQNLAALGCTVELCGAIGADPHGEELSRELLRHGIGTRGLLAEPQRKTTHKLRVVAQGQHLLRIDREERVGVAPQARIALYDYLATTVATVDCVILSDYQKGFLDPELIGEVIRLARQHQKPVVVDPKGTGYSRYKGALALTPNLAELELATGLRAHDEGERVVAAQRLLEQTSAQAVLVTCGKDGMLLVPSQGTPTRIAAEAREVYDVTGAGDTVIAVFALGIARGMAIESAARLANSAAGIVVGKLGTATVSPEELALAAQGSWPTDRKLVDLQKLMPVLARARGRGRRVVFTNGCFDLLHPGHVSLLQEARRHGDLLVVGLNSDASVRGLKGDSRPLLPFADRALMLAALWAVDFVIGFDAPTPLELIQAIRPEVLVKGGDYQPHQVVGREVVQDNGGKVVIVPQLPGHSTTTLAERLRQR